MMPEGVLPEGRADATGAPLLAVTDLRVEFRSVGETVGAVDGVTFGVEPGRVLSIVGESGCGKSTAAMALLGLLPDMARVTGSVRLHGQELVGLGRRTFEDLRGRDIAMIFQDPMTSLNPTKRIGAQIGEPLRRHLGMSKDDARARAIELLEEVRIPRAQDRVDAYPHELSGGMRQRVMIAMAVACGPQLLVADEPTTALDVTVQAEILEILDRLCAEHGMAMVLITHDMGVVAKVAHEVLVMYAGQVVEQAPVDALFEHPEHPYTQGLLGAVPQMDRPDVRVAPLKAIPGQPPDLRDPPRGCRFAPRCAYAASDTCALSDQELREIRPGHLVRTQHPASERPAVVGSAS